MFRFFRLIRQKLISESKFNRYLLYAFGEIFLVVIGILIALQINNWNQQKINRQYELTMLKEVKAALEVDLQGYKYLVPFFKNVDYSIKQLVILKENPSNSLDSIKHHLDILRSFGVASLINFSPFEAIKSGGLDRISNPEIRKNISTLYGFTLRGTEDMINEIVREELFNRRQYLESIFDSKVSLTANGKISSDLIINDPTIIKDNSKFEQLLSHSGWFFPIIIRQFSDAIKKMEELSAQIEIELNK